MPSWWKSSCRESAGKLNSWTTTTKYTSRSSGTVAMAKSPTSLHWRSCFPNTRTEWKRERPPMSLSPESEQILVFDFGAQYGQLIARRVREQNVFCQLVRHDLRAERVAELKPRGIILSGGPASVYATGAPHCDPAIFDLGVPVLGICYGMQLACQVLGGEVKPASSREFGRAHCHIREANGLFQGVPQETVVWMS